MTHGMSGRGGCGQLASHGSISRRNHWGTFSRGKWTKQAGNPRVSSAGGAVVGVVVLARCVLLTGEDLGQRTITAQQAVRV